MLKAIPQRLVASRDDGQDDSTKVIGLCMDDSVTGWHFDDNGCPGISYLLPESNCVKHWEFIVGDLAFIPEEAGGNFARRTKGNLFLTQRPGHCIFIPSCIYHRVTTVGVGLSCGSYTSRDVNLEAFGRRLGTLRQTETREHLNACMLHVLERYKDQFPEFSPGTTDSVKIEAVVRQLREPYITRKRKTPQATGQKQKRHKPQVTGHGH